MTGTDTNLVKHSLLALAKTIGEAIGEWEENEGFEISHVELAAGGVRLIAVRDKERVDVEAAPLFGGKE